MRARAAPSWNWCGVVVLKAADTDRHRKSSLPLPPGRARRGRRVGGARSGCVRVSLCSGTMSKFDSMANSWGLIWNETAGGLCEGGQHLNASRLLPRDAGAGQCNERSSLAVVPTTEHCNPSPSAGSAPASLGSTSTWWVPSTATAATAERDASEVLRFAYVSQHADPVLHVLIRGNCRAVPLDPSLSARRAAALCIARSPHALCGSVEQPKLYAGMHLAEAHETPLLLQARTTAACTAAACTAACTGHPRLHRR